MGSSTSCDDGHALAVGPFTRNISPSCHKARGCRSGERGVRDWVAVKELKLSYQSYCLPCTHSWET